MQATVHGVVKSQARLRDFTSLTWVVHLSVTYLFASLTVHGVLKARILKWFAIPFSSGPRFVRILHRDSSVLNGHTRHGS